MAKRSVRNETTRLDPVFPIPDGVEELVYNDNDVVDTDVEEGDDDSGIIIDDGGDPTNYGDDPETPQILDIFSQTIRRTPSGAEVIDVVFDADDVAGFTNYELRVTKI